MHLKREKGLRFGRSGATRRPKVILRTWEGKVTKVYSVDGLIKFSAFVAKNTSGSVHNKVLTKNKYFFHRLSSQIRSLAHPFNSGAKRLPAYKARLEGK